MLKLEEAKDVEEMAKKINDTLKLIHDIDKIFFMRSQNSKSNVIARTLVLPAQWRFVYGEKKTYIIEVISEKFDNLTCDEKIYVVIHELMHIPRTMKGLRGHNYKGFRMVNVMSRKIRKQIC
ncbi:MULTISPECIES: putative metallopeptidase [Acidianus]|uniref:Putative phage metallopeptidase domain-containing protein n=1 Tax=Candidatus Acidianus copahuensis TaxID=1160895 RepID=A0A031LL80_9CREN|nr:MULTISPECIES: putative metallopeptidase [Acidianus]EZQ02257.1 hypothetical protein CM19_10655 [Candidatus Acidianus copahuensis]NON62943.1 metallopeptidase [Acidianus sp. RZ1]